MAKTIHYFNVRRKIDGVVEDVQLHAECDVEPFCGYAQIDGTIFLDIDGEDPTPWNGSLTMDERSRIERSAYAEWKATNEAPMDFDDEFSAFVDDYSEDLSSLKLY